MSLPENAVEQFSDCLTDSLIPSADGFSFIKLSLAKYRGSEAGLNKISVRVLEVKGQPHLSFTYHYQTRDVTKNFRIEDGLAQIQTYLDQSQADSFKSAHLRLQGLETQLLFNKKNEATIQTTAAANTAVVSQAHDREKIVLLISSARF